MRRVIITFQDGRQEQYATMEQASKALGCSSPSLHRIMDGISTRLSVKHGIKSIELKEPHGKPKGMRKRGGGKHPVLCENEVTGESFTCDSIQEAKEKTNFDHAIHYFVDTGQYHWNWRFSSIEKTKTTIAFPTPVPQEVIGIIYHFASIYVYHRCLLRASLAEDAIQEITTAVVADVSKGKYEQYKHKYKMEIWLWYRVKMRGWKIANRIREWENLKAECPERPDANLKGHEANDHWLENLASTTDPDMSIFDDMPPHLKPLAECLLHGMVATEVCRELGIYERTRQEMMRELRQWLRRYNSDNG